VSTVFRHSTSVESADRHQGNRSLPGSSNIPRPPLCPPPCSNCSADRTTHPWRTQRPARVTNILVTTPRKPGGRVERPRKSEETALLMSVQDGSGWARDPIRAAGGRRRYNADRQIRARLRQVEVVKLLIAYGGNRGANVRIAKELGVSEATVSRDIKAILARPSSRRPSMAELYRRAGITPPPPTRRRSRPSSDATATNIPLSMSVIQAPKKARVTHAGPWRQDPGAAVG